jgi:transcriptional regulator with XRE-family HTH domain
MIFWYFSTYKFLFHHFIKQKTPSLLNLKAKGDLPMLTKRLRALREDSDIKQKEIAEALQIKPNTYNRYECGVNEPDIAMLIKLADYFEVSLDYLLAHEPKNTNNLPDLSHFLLSGDYQLFGRTPTDDERQKLAAVVKLFFS